jgi:hypothetical protein
MKSWFEIPKDSADWRRALAHKLGGFVARLFLFASVFLLHPGERCAYETDRRPALLDDVPSGVALQPTADAPSRPDDLPPKI